jgi:hypothetical protein
MDHDKKIQKLASDVHDLNALLLVSFAAMRRLALLNLQMAQLAKQRNNHDHRLTAEPFPRCFQRWSAGESELAY